MNKLKFQERAQDEFVESAKALLARDGRSTLTLKAPTGAGKTVMMANALAQLSTACQGVHSLAILWVAPNKLHEQSHARLLSVYGRTKALDCLFPDELSTTEIPEKAILFLNWASIDSEKLVLRRDNETGRNLATLIDKAKVVGRKIILVVDESHLHLDSGPQAKVVIDHIIRPNLVIEVSATPRGIAKSANGQLFESIIEPADENGQEVRTTAVIRNGVGDLLTTGAAAIAARDSMDEIRVTVARSTVVAAELIRKRVIVNPDMEVRSVDDDLVINYTGTSENLLDLALDKQAELTRMYQSEGALVVPLILVQLPSKNIDKNALDRFETYLGARHKLFRGRGLEVWLAEDQTEGLEDIASFGSGARVLFFKQGIATGWDCPRAQILVGLREMKSDTFTTQVLGRIIRQPEGKHYKEEALNYGYAFTNYDRLKLDAESASWMGKAMLRAEAPFSIPFINWVPTHVDRRNHLNRAALEAMLAHKGVLGSIGHVGPVVTQMVANVPIDDIDVTREEMGSRAISLDVQGLQGLLDARKADLVRELADQGSGRKYIEAALRMTAGELVDSADEKVQLETILHSENWPHFEEMVRCGIEEFKATQEKAARALVQRDAWTAPQVRFVDLSEPLDGYKHCLYKPVLKGQFEKSNVEQPFTRWLDNQDTVALWLKNGDSGGEHFAIQYEHSGELRLFYVDFLVRLTDGMIGLFDTKGAGKTEMSTGNMQETFSKAKALHAYVENLRAHGHKVRGGIVVWKDSDWWVHEGLDYPGTSDISEAHGWKRLRL